MSSSSNSNHSDNASDSSFLDEVIAEYIRACETGEPPDRDELLAQHPDLADELREFFANRDQMDQVAQPMRNLVARVLNVRCPHCHNPIELLEEAPLTDISCPACGSSFSLVGERTEARYPTGSKMLGHFELLNHFGIGAFGSVWKARDTKLDRTVAIKIPRRGHLDESETEMFLRDARAAAQLKHPNIASVHEVGKQDDTIYIVSDFIQGVTLKEWMAAKPLTPREAAELCVKIANALHHAHEAGVIHRDLKPGNIMIEVKGHEGVKGQESSDKSQTNSDPPALDSRLFALNSSNSPALDSGLLTLDSIEPHIVDFGLAKREAGEITMTVEGQILGTPAYMSPEQARGEGHTVDRRADVYSLGVILFELLTGELPFRGDKQMLLVQILNDDPPSPRKLNSSVPRDLDTICLKCLEKDPLKRYATTDELTSDLIRWQMGTPIRARRSGAVENTVKWIRRNPTAALSLLASAAVACALVGVAVGQLYTRKVERTNSLLANALDREQTLRKEREQALAREEQTNAQLRESARREKRLGKEKELALLEARRAKRIAEVAMHQSENLSYLLHISNVQRAISEGDINTAERFLQACPEDLRRFEWHYLRRLCRIESVFANNARIECTAVSPTGDQVAIVDSDQKLKVLATKPVLTLVQLDHQVHSPTCAQFVRDGRELLVGKADGSVDLLAMPNGRFVCTFSQKDDPQPAIQAIAASESGEHFAAIHRYTSSGESSPVRGRVVVWRLEESQPRHSIEGRPSCIAFSPDGTLLAVGSGYITRYIRSGRVDDQPGRIRLLDVASGRQLNEFPNDHLVSGVLSVCFDHEGKQLVTGHGDNNIRIWDLDKGRPALVLQGHTAAVWNVAFVQGKRELISCSSDQTIRFWNADDGALRHKYRGHTDAIRNLAVPYTGDLFVTGADDRAVKLWTSSDPMTVTSSRRPDILIDVAFSPCGAEVACTSLNRALSIFAADSGKEMHRFSCKGVSLAYSPNGEQIVTGGRSTAIAVWDAKTGVEARQWTFARVGNGSRVSVSPDGSLVATRTLEGITVWHVATGQIELVVGVEHKETVFDVVFSPNGEILAYSTGFSNRPGSVVLCDARTGKVIRVLKGPKRRIWDIDFSPDGKRIAAATGSHSGPPGQIFIWEVSSGQTMHELRGHRFGVWCVRFTPDGQRLASGAGIWRGGPGELKIWDTEFGRELLDLKGHTSVVMAVAFSNDGSRLAAASEDGTVKIWTAKEPLPLRQRR